jgi:ribosomal protein L7/L12
VLAVPWFTVAREFRRREQLGFDPAEPDVPTLVRQGRKIEAVKRYREQHPGTSLRQAKHAVDGL